MYMNQRYAGHMKSFQNIKAGDLVLAYTYNSDKIHLVRFRVRRVYKEGVPVDEEPLFLGSPLCQMSTKYYWSFRDRSLIWQDFEEEALCRRCGQRWRALKKPPVATWTDQTELQGRAMDVRLPFGWKRVSAVGHPSDTGKEDDKNDDGVTIVRVGVRKELARWQRGHMYVRFVEHCDREQDRFGTFYGDDRFVDRDYLYQSGISVKMVKAAEELMAKGGFR